MKKTSKMLSAAAGVTAIAAAASSYITAKLLVKTALDRNQPKIMKKANSRISGGKGDAEFDKARMAAAEALDGKPHETVEIVSCDGINLVGHFSPCENAKRIIIAFHGWRSSWNYDYGMIADFWHSSGCSVLYAEQRGQSQSGGDFMGFGLTERYDCADWADWAVSRFGESIPIYLAGVSMGAATVLMASNLILPKSVCGIMADCGFTSPKAIWKHIARKNLHISYGMRGVMVDAMCRKRINMGADGYSAKEALKNTDIPVLFIHGTDDTFVPIEMTYENYKACASPKRLLVVPGADHAMSYYTNKAEYEKAELEFWRDFDKKAEKTEEKHD